ncbi:MAG TPA: YCF48-related protein [Cyclobacteriaceae bacterium]|nr:YCF48-related protein [Cyclobacteriaceae bacterium]
MRFLFLLIICTLPAFGQEYHLTKVETGIAATFRALSVVDNQVAWLSGSKGWTGLTNDGGKTWNFSQVKGFENSDFRSLYGFDDQRAVIANAGSPTTILLTEDGGKTWHAVYSNNHKDAFVDGVDFWNKNDGLMMGDRIEGKMLLLRTHDGGRSWTAVQDAPLLSPGEGSFAASGTGIRCTGKRDVMICTGGTISRLWKSEDQGTHWSFIPVPVIQGQSTTGIFSFLSNNSHLIVVGGNYKDEWYNHDHNFYSKDGGAHWLTPVPPARGFRECVEPINNNTLIATGPSGTDISYDNGITWKGLSDEKGLHVVRKARNGNRVMAAGNNGLVFIVE